MAGHRSSRPDRFDSLTGVRYLLKLCSSFLIALVPRGDGSYGWFILGEDGAQCR